MGIIIKTNKQAQTKPKKIILCADDYGYNEAVSSAIITLIKQQRISATSCMTNFAHWQQLGPRLLPFNDKIDLGLHFNLTTGYALKRNLGFTQTSTHRYPALKTLLLKSYLKQITQLEVEQELNAQLDRFIAVIGQPPCYIDGERHVHQFPIIQDALINVIKQRLPHKTYVRSLAKITGTQSGKIKAGIIRHSGAEKLRQKLKHHAIPYNACFSGLYDFTKAVLFPRYFNAFLAAADSGGLIYCHPGKQTSNSDDPIAAARVHEFNYLASDQFLSDLDLHSVQLSRFNAAV